MEKIKKIKIKSFKSFSGKLIPITFNKKFPFAVKRIFYLYGIKNKIRGDHAHKKCSQLFMAVSGDMILNIKTPYSKKSFSSSRSPGSILPRNQICSPFISLDKVPST